MASAEYDGETFNALVTVLVDCVTTSSKNSIVATKPI